MQSVHSYLVEVDSFFYNTLETEGQTIHIGDRGGHLGHTKPQHGKVISTIKGSEVKVGDTLFFVHFDLYDAEEKDGKTTVLVSQENEIAYSTNFPDNYNLEKIKRAKILPLNYAVAEKIPNPDFANDGVIRIYNPPKYLPQQYKVLHEIKKLGIRKNHKVCVYKGSDYMLPYLPDIAFLMPEFITFNMSSMACVGEYCLIEVKEVGMAVADGIHQEVKYTVPNAIGVSSRNVGSVKKGDVVRFHWRKAQQSPLHPTLFNPLYSQLMTVYEN